MAGKKVTVQVGERRLVLSNLDTPLYSTGFCKTEVVPYYTHIAPVLLPHISRRPITISVDRTTAQHAEAALLDC